MNPPQAEAPIVADRPRPTAKSGTIVEERENAGLQKKLHQILADIIEAACTNIEYRLLVSCRV